MRFIEPLAQISMNILSYWLPIINIAAFTAMGMDKYRAQNQKWRIPEKTLFILAVIGGSFGGIVGMYVYRHKTQQKKFAVGFPAILIIQITAGLVINLLI